MTSERTARVTIDQVIEFAHIIGLKASREELEAILPLVEAQVINLDKLRSMKVDNRVEPDVVFTPGPLEG
jgi:hypothetical protein